MAALTIRRLDENDVAALYRRYPGAPGPQPCFLTLDVASGSFSAGYDDPGRPVPEPEPVQPESRFAGSPLRSPVLRWPIPCLTAEGANQVLDTLAPLARKVIDGAHWDDRDHSAWLTDDAAAAVHKLTRLCADTDLIVDLLNEVIEEHDAREWFEEDDLAREHGITAQTTDEQLAALADRLTMWAVPNARPAAIVLGVHPYLTEIRDGLRTSVTQ
jgi:hypothetical protein